MSFTVDVAPRPHRPRRIVARTLALGLSALLAAGLLAWSPGTTSGWNQAAAEGTLWQLLNGARTNNGIAPLQYHGTLVSIARWRSSDMLERDYFSHTILGCGCDVYVYYTRNGIDWAWGGENIAWNQRSDAESPIRAHNQFMESAGHRANVLNRAFTHGGVGAAATTATYQGATGGVKMYTELFLQAPAAPAPAPAPQPPPPQPAPAAPPTGGGSAPSAQPAPVATPEPEPEPEPARVAMDAPQRPVSATGLTGQARTVVRVPFTPDLATALLADDRAAERIARLVPSVPIVADAASTAPLQVAAPEPAPGGVLDGIVTAVIGFLFG
jgi:uncharacterized protein YkwD